MSAAVQLNDKAVMLVDAVPQNGKFKGGAFVSVQDAGQLAGCFFIPAHKLREVVSLLQATDTTDTTAAGTL